MEHIAQRDARIIELFLDSYTISDVSGACNVSRNTVERVLRRELTAAKRSTTCPA
jgi:AraC-like DNA-binding protein